MGGTIARYRAEGHDVIVALITGHGDQETHPVFGREAFDTVRAEFKEAMGVLGATEILMENVPAAMVGDVPTYEVNRVAQRIVNDVRPDRLYLPFLYDLHRDHRELFHAFSVAWRPSSEVGRRIECVATYETVSETHWNFPYVEAGFLPNRYVDISAHLETKIEALRCYKSQIRPMPDARSLEGIRALAVYRGSQVGMHAAEAFVVVRSLVPAS